MTNAIELICCAIATQEGAFTPGTTPAVRSNPGDLRYAGQTNASAPGWDGKGDAPIATFSAAHGCTALQLGTVGLYRDILAKASQGLTLRQMIYVFAPPSENNSAQYLANVLEWTGLPSDVPVASLIAPLVRLTGPASAPRT